MKYVAYGSNMNLKQMEHRCSKSTVIGNGKLIGYKLVFNVHADILYTGNKKDFVPVVIWEINDDDWEMLDIYEGFPTYYTKEIVSVITDDGMDNKIVNAIVYVMTDGEKGFEMPYDGYFYTIVNGYNNNGLNLKPLYDALDYTDEMMMKGSDING